MVHIHTTAQIGKDIDVKGMADLREQNSQANTTVFSKNIDIIAPFYLLLLSYTCPQQNTTESRCGFFFKPFRWLLLNVVCNAYGYSE